MSLTQIGRRAAQTDVPVRNDSCSRVKEKLVDGDAVVSSLVQTRTQLGSQLASAPGVPAFAGRVNLGYHVLPLAW